MLKYTISLLAMLLVSYCARAQEDEDSTANKKVVVTQNQLCIGADFFQPVINSFSGAKKSYEIMIDYALEKDVYAVLEGGFGNAKVDYTSPALRYTSSNSFFRMGVNKSMLTRMHRNDWDCVFIGVRYAMGFIRRSDAYYEIENQYFGNTSGMVPATGMTAHWLELTGGLRVELFKGICAGYNVRTKFLMNPKAFRELAPYYIAGFGKGEKTAVFDFNMYISYAIRWAKKKPTAPQQ
ncbi:MAG: hypothetical protein JNL72_11585 [Flavipsychrobacter sp.]|nr:hypothetical protein [Flavipsychrobacter sp.]